MDLRFNTNGNFFGVRAACIIYSKDGSKILAHVEENSDHIALPGGGVAFGENSCDTIKREVREELGLDIKNVNIKGTIENFFVYKERNVHGLELIYQAEFVESHPYKAEILDGIEERERKLVFKWVDIDKLEDLNLKPEIIRNEIKNKNSDIFHLIVEK